MNTKPSVKSSLLAATLLGCLAGSSYGAITVTPNNNANDLTGALLGSGITLVGAPTFDGAPASAGGFTDGLSAGIGIDTGIVLTTGDVNLITDTNTEDGIGMDNNLPGNTVLDGISGVSTFDATSLTFDFQFGDGSTGGDLFFNYVFGSDEYNEFANSNVNDAFAFLLDGVNVALLDDGVTPVSINTINGGDPFGTGAVNPDLFNNNDLDDGGPFFDFEYDGFTDVLSVSALGLAPGTHTIELVIADGGDGIFDSGVFIQGGPV